MLEQESIYSGLCNNITLYFLLYSFFDTIKRHMWPLSKHGWVHWSNTVVTCVTRRYMCVHVVKPCMHTLYQTCS